MLVCPNCKKGKFDSEWTNCLSPICDDCKKELEEENEKDVKY